MRIIRYQTPRPAWSATNPRRSLNPRRANALSPRRGARRRSSIQVRSRVDLLRHLPDVDLEALLHLLEHLRVLVRGHEGQREALRAEAPRAADPVQVGVAVR